jgi:two-component system CheB/CheR fusion protein
MPGSKRPNPVESVEKVPGEHGFLVVGIGASAGGIPALGEFFSKASPDAGVGYVVILHLSPDHDSHLAHVLQQVTKMPVEQVTRQTKIRPNHVYVVPPDKNLSMKDGSIVVKPIKTIEERRAPVDIFFRTLAESHGQNAVGVILSGTGANGSMGIKRIKEFGGATFAQNPREAEFNEMPRNSIATEFIDMILPVGEIPGHIIRYRDRVRAINIPEEPADRPEEQQTALRDIFTQLKVRTGHDFSNYKRPTMLRRIERRISVKNLPDIAAYTDYLREHPDEANALLKDLLISVTNFFRDKKAFESIEKNVLPKMIAAAKPTDPVRIWVAGCATGEEAYSIAMIAAELSSGIDDPPVQIFATDIDAQSIAFAREGLYTLNDAADVSPERLRRFFTLEGQSYRVRREIREMVLFAQHNLLKDPPFSHLDIISCRNLLIYLNHTAQERVLETIHFALKPGGYLLVGTSESVDGSGDLFLTVDKQNHIFQSRQVAARPFPVPESVPVYRAAPFTVEREKHSRGLERITYNDLHLRLLEDFAPPSVVVNQDYEIVHLSRRAGKYMRVAGGEPNNNLLRLIRQEIRLELRTALFQAVQQKNNVEVRNLKVNTGGREEIINLLVRPVTNEDDTARGFILVIFEPVEPGQTDLAHTDYQPPEPVVHQLEEELVRSRKQLQSALEQAEVQSEELRASNEELQAMNEELRSSTEELETSKEELQSINEELTTVNQELKVKIDELSHTNNNFTNLLSSIDIGVIFLDRSLRINLFSQAASRIFNLISSDVGRPLSDLSNQLDYVDLAADADLVLEKLQTVERQVKTTAGQVFVMRILPYRTLEDRINGVVLTFVDVTERSEAENAVAAELEGTTTLHDLSQRLVSEADIQVVYDEILESALRLAKADGGTVQIFDEEDKTLTLLAARGFSRQMQEHFYRVDAGSNTTCGLALAAGMRTIIDYDNESLEDADGSLKMHLYEGYRTGQSTPLVTRGGRPIGMLSTHWRSHYRPTDRELRFIDLLARQASDVIAQWRLDSALRRSEEKYRTLFDSMDEGYCIIEMIYDETGKPVDWRYCQVNRAFEINNGLHEAEGKTIRELAPDIEQKWIEAYDRVARTGKSRRFEEDSIALGRVFSLFAFRIGDPAERKVAVIFTDITERRRAKDALAFQSHLLNTVEQAIIATDLEGRVTYWNSYAERLLGWTADEAIGRNVLELDVPESEVEKGAEIMQALRQGRTWSGDFTLRRKDGSTFPAHVFDTPITDEKGDLIGIVGVSIDITERLRTERALRATEERMRLLMESFTDVAIFTTDTEGIVTAWNPGSEKIFGFTADEMIGKQSADIIFTPEDREMGAARAERRTAIKEGKALDERWHMRKNGERFYASGFMVALTDGQKHVGFGKIAQDLTERVRAEQAVRERGMLKRLVDAQEEERHRIARDLHDHLGQQLTALRLKLEGLKSTYGAEPAMIKALDETQEQAKAIDDEVTFMTWELRPTALDNLGLRNALAAYVAEWSKNYDIEAEFHSARLRKSRLLPEIEINLYRIAQEALNNIVKHSKAGKADVMLEYGKDSVVLMIEDNGVGFDLKAATRKTKKGRLGLVGMRERAALFGGTLEIESAQLRGTTVIAHVPALYTPNPPPKRKSTAKKK